MFPKTSKFNQAISYFRTILDPNRFKFRKYYRLALSYEAAGDKGKAIEYYQGCLKFHRSLNVTRNIGMLYYEIGDYLRAINYLEKSDFDLEVGLILGLSYLELNALEKTEQIMDRIKSSKSTYSRMLAEHIRAFENRREQCGEDSVSDNCCAGGKTCAVGYPYDVLELTDASSKTEIKRAYLRMVKKWHPDRFFNDQKLQSRAEQKMKIINEAYYTLGKC